MYHERLWQLVVVCSVLLVSVSSFNIKITSNSPVLLGDSLVLNATVYDEQTGEPKDARFCFTWNFRDLTNRSEDSPPNSSWVIPVQSNWHSGSFTGTLDVAERYLGYCPFPSTKKFHIKLTDTITGSLELQQQNETVTKDYLFTNVPTNHTIVVDSSQWQYVMSHATSVQVTWLVDCVNVSTSNSLSMMNTYKKDSNATRILAVIDANFVPPTTTTTSTSTTTTTTTQAPVTQAPVTEGPPNANTTLKAKVAKRAVPVTIPTTTSSPLVSDCLRQYVREEPGHVYGFFEKKIQVKTPISNVTITGNKWGKKGERVQLNFKCQGSPPFHYCMRLCRGICNATGHEDCAFPIPNDDCDFSVNRYVYDDKPVTMIVIIQNDVSTVVRPSVINIIVDPGNQGQLSVVLVPVAFMLLALAAVIYGIAYYVQNRRIAIVEVADFNFGDVGTDMEYKSFRQRLVESVHEAVSEVRQNRSGVPTDLTGDTSVGYGSMK